MFGEPLGRMRDHTDLPVYVPELGCTGLTVDGRDPGAKSRWLRDAFAYFDASEVSLVAYVEVDRATDWQVFGGSGGENTVTIGGTRHRTYPGTRAGIRAFRGL